MSSFSSLDQLGDERWRTAFEIIQRTQHLPFEERKAAAEAATSDAAILSLVFEMWEEEEEVEGSSGEDTEPQPGERLGRYEILDKRGSGGMGRVYMADDLELGRRVALKFLSSELAARPGALDGLIKEAKAASALNHPYIVTVYEVIRTEDRTAIAMELVEGVSLRERCGSSQPIAKVVEWGRQIASALAAAHQKGIVHRDIKPENVMLRADGFIKVVDFGMAQQTVSGREGSLSARQGGTVRYSSPEQARGERSASPSDIFSLGMVLYELATGSHPFASDSPLQTLEAIAHADPLAPAKRNPLVPAAVNQLIVDMLAKPAAARPTAEEVAARLTAAQAAPRRRWLGIVAAGLAAAIAAAGVWVWRSSPVNTVTHKLTATGKDNRVTHAAVSPDGRQLAYAQITGELFVRSLVHYDARLLNGPAGLEIKKIAWFPDQTRLLVTARAGLGGPSSAWIIPTSGGVAQLARENAEIASPSPDGTRIVFTTANSTEIWVAGLGTDSEAPHRLVPAGPLETFPVVEWAAGGRRLVCQRLKYLVQPRAVSQEPHHLRSFESIDSATGAVVMREDGISMRSAVVLPDGRVLFLWTDSDPKSLNLLELRMDPAAERIIARPRPFATLNELQTEAELALGGITSSLDGRHVVVINSNVEREVQVADLDGARHRLTSHRMPIRAPVDMYPHAWSHDSETLYFESSRKGTYDIFRQSLGEAQAQFIAGGPHRVEFNPILTPDAKWILFASSPKLGKSAGKRLDRVPVKGGEPAAVPIGGPLDFFDCGGATGRCVLRTTEAGEWAFHELDPVKGKGRELARVPAAENSQGDWGLSPAGTEVAIPNRDESDPRILLVTLDGQPKSATRLVRVQARGRVAAVRYAPGGSGWFIALRHEAEYFESLPQNRGELAFVDPTGKVFLFQETMLNTIPLPAPNGSRIAFIHGTPLSDAMLFEQ